MSSRHKKIQQQLQIVKSSGETQPFSVKKLKRSFERCGLKTRDCDSVIQKLKPQLKQGMTTKNLYSKAYRLLHKTSPMAAVLYSLKRALFELGPTGYHFEDYMAKYAQELGYETEVRKILQGEAVTHEVDVLAHKKKGTVLMECKFHNHQGKKNDIKLVLYVKARFDDLKNGKTPYRFNELWIASNTSFTQDALKFAQFHNIQLLGTNSPKDENLLSQIERMKLYPITSLKRLTSNHITALLDRGIFLVKELVNEPEAMRRIGMDDHEIARLYPDIFLLLGRDS
jgi:hypothetical protein